MIAVPSRSSADPTLMGTLSEAIEDLARQGYTEHFRVVGDTLEALGSGQIFRADEVAIRQHHRFEGVSDPDDMSIVYAIESTSGVRGILVDAFGVYASPAVGALLDKVLSGRLQDVRSMIDRSPRSTRGGGRAGGGFGARP